MGRAVDTSAMIRRWLGYFAGSNPMERNLSISISGFSDAVYAERLGTRVGQVIHILADKFELDLRRLHQITLARDYPLALSEFYNTHRGGQPAHRTAEDYATGVAQTCCFLDDHDVKIQMIISAALVAALAADDPPQDLSHRASAPLAPP